MSTKEDNDLVCNIRVEYRGKVLQMNRVSADFVIEDLIPPKGPEFDLDNLARLSHRSERRKRFVDMISGEFAHAITEALFKIGDK